MSGPSAGFLAIARLRPWCYLGPTVRLFPDDILPSLSGIGFSRPAYLLSRSEFIGIGYH